MKLSFSTLGCPDWTLNDIAMRAKEYGYDGVELRGEKGKHISTDIGQHEREKTKKLFEINNIEIMAIAAYTRFSSPDREERRMEEKKLKEMVGLASDIGCQNVRTFGGSIPQDVNRDECSTWVAESFVNVAGYAQECGVNIALETHDSFTSGKHISEVLTKANHPNLKALWDMSNTLCLGEELEDTAKYIKNYIQYVHLRDMVKRDGLWKPALMGEGDLPVEQFIPVLKKINFDGYCSLEWEKLWHPEIENPEIAFPQYVKKMREMMAD